jgi:hypothetical protein
MQIRVAAVGGGRGKQFSIKIAHSEIFLKIPMPFTVLVVCSFLAVKGYLSAPFVNEY